MIYLDILENKIDGISPLENLEILDVVILCGNNISDYSPVSHVPNVIKTPEEAQKYFSTLYDASD